MGGSSKSNALQAGLPAFSAVNSGQDASLDMTARYARPEATWFDPNQINNDVRTFAKLNQYRAETDEREISPELAATRDAYKRDMQALAEQGNRLPQSYSNDLAKLGIYQGLQGGSRDFTGRSIGARTIEDIYGRGAEDYQRQRRGEVGNYLSGNPQQQTGVDAGELVSSDYQQRAANIALNNNWRAQLANLNQNRWANLNNQTNSLMGAAAQQAQGNAAGANAQKGAAIGALGSLAAVAGTAAIMA